MTAPLSAERAERLKKFVHSQTRDIDHFNPDGWNKRADLLSILDDYSSMREENERLEKENKQMRNSTAKEVICCRCGKETLFYTIAPYGSVNDRDPICAECLEGGPQDWNARAEKAEAELAQAKKDYDWMMAQHDMWKACAFKEAELKDGFKAELAALALREEKK